MSATQLPLPHFLNLPLPPIPPDRQLVFKLNLSQEQFNELGLLDAEIEEGEEGGLRLDFDPSGKGKLHLSPSRLLLLNPPRSAPSRTNKPEEIYCCHTPAIAPSSSHSSLSGVLRIPTNTSVYELQRFPTSDHSSAPPITSHAEPNQPSTNNPQPVKNARPTPELSQREKLAGQRLKEKRLEEDRKKKEKQMVVLPDGYSPAAPVPKRTRQAKTKAPNKQQFPTAAKAQSTNAGTNASALSSSKNQSQPVAQPLPPRRALPGSQTGKHLAHVHNQHLTNPPTPPLKAVTSLSQPEPPPLTQPPLPIPAPPAVVFKPPTSSRRAKPLSTTQPISADSKVVTPSEPPSATKLRTTTGLLSISDEGEVDQHSADTTTQTFKLPTPPVASLKHTDPSQLPISSPRPDVSKNGSHVPHPHTSPTEPDGIPSTHERTNSTTSITKRPSSKRPAELGVVKATDYSLQTQQVESAADRDIPNSPTKKQRTEMLTPNPNTAPPPSRPKKSQKRAEADRRLTQPNAEPNHSAELPSTSATRPSKAEDPSHKPAITVKKIPVPTVTERNQASTTIQVENTATPPIVRKRVLEPESVSGGGGGALTKRVRQEEGGSGLPTIRKVVRASVANGESSSTTTNGQNKRVKKKKKLKQPIDYTSSEVEEGEEPGEIVRSSTRTQPPPPPSEVAKAPPLVATEAIVEEPGPTKSMTKTLSNQSDQTNKASTNQPTPNPLLTLEETNNNSNNNNTSYNNSRLLFYKLNKHYEFVCKKLEELKENKTKITSLNQVECLIFEAVGLEIELDRLKNRIIRLFSSSSSTCSNP